MLSGAIKSWPDLLRKASNHLNPGGWLEVTEFEVWVHSQNDKMKDAPEIQSKIHPCSLEPLVKSGEGTRND
jgi:hypothetical protein